MSEDQNNMKKYKLKKVCSICSSTISETKEFKLGDLGDKETRIILNNLCRLNKNNCFDHLYDTPKFNLIDVESGDCVLDNLPMED
jgi:hypothetical protein